ncbi:benzoate 4-monooxygenase cytochrome P450 [Aspergillus sclerotioniger CBS 115572]|uniref:Benzoate 4-monooxygenase cytochrome P450 n=1 Tax=Aspergillus sclerotioniger CBS 115572 TaxID=1450535 RepID=A0A317WVJ3_9EURO|nr:benzoate 4-monooxygenase cytochrome P450 [Aspergillus sclerotioniger CBS 115572]PWY90379.1 benzoate 4-monooxygenase cytochrome P450 [Aspergillus sclerotioniger CBS 115572]
MALSLILATLFTYFLVRPLVSYLYDAKSLRKYPNVNFLAGFTSLAYVWERRRSFRTRHLHLQHQHHPILRLGPNTLSFADTRAIKDIYGHGTPCRKDDVYILTIGSHAHVLNVLDREDHARKRRMLSHAFATRNLEHWEFKISDKIRRLITQLDQRCTLPLSVGEQVIPSDLTLNFRLWSNLFTIDAIADIALSEQLGMLDSGTDMMQVNGLNRRLSYIESLHAGNHVTSLFFGAADWFSLFKTLSSLLSPHWRKQWNHAQAFGGIASALAGKRLQKHEDGDRLSDIFACLIEDKAGKSRCLDRGEIEAETHLLLDAGSDTTAIALTHALYYLLKHPHCLAELRKEVDDALSGDTIASYEKVRNLPYLKACLEESLRLSPPVSRGLERRTPPEGMRIMGEMIPGDVAVSVPTYVAHRDPLLFPDPDAYRPGRWLDNTEQTKQMREAFIPFSTGARGCIGRNITMIEQQICIATLVHRYAFALPSPDWTLDWHEAFLLWPSQMPLRIWRRDV